MRNRNSLECSCSGRCRVVGKAEESIVRLQVRQAEVHVWQAVAGIVIEGGFTADAVVRVLKDADAVRLLAALVVIGWVIPAHHKLIDQGGIVSVPEIVDELEALEALGQLGVHGHLILLLGALRTVTVVLRVSRAR